MLGRYLPLWLKTAYFCSVAFLLTIVLGSEFIRALYNFLEIPIVLVAIGLYCIFLWLGTIESSESSQERRMVQCPKSVS